ncbi:monocarboxylate transporter 12-like isoform X2 [Ptychodera flava]|uniref:monocarboxylate transporter 12-like isoform X2 n=1 Tax=Ptychodera flava TaxID=63121 RepID=UPI00396A4BCD
MTDVGISRQKPPDGGWGWLIVLATFTIFTIAGGNVYSIGVLFVAFLDAFGRSKADTSWIGSIFGFSLCMSSSVGIALAKKLGHRKTVMISGFVVSCGILGSSFATELYHVYISYGIVTGIGLGLTFTVSIEMVSIYFKRRLKIAVGIALAGVGAGQLILSLLTQFLVETYGWRGTLIILSAFEAHVCVAGALLRPLTTEVNDPVQPSNSPVSVVVTTNHDSKDSKLDGDDEYFHDIISYPPSEVTAMEEDKRKEDSILCSVKSFLKTVFGVELLKKPICLFLLFISIGYGFSELIVFVHLVRRARDFGIGDTQSAYLPAVMGLIQLTGRPIIGVVGQIPCVKAHAIVGVVLAVFGVFTVISTYIRSFAGWIRDKYGVYDIAFLTSGLVSMLMSAVTFALPYIDRALKRGRPKRPTTAIN